MRLFYPPEGRRLNEEYKEFLYERLHELDATLSELVVELRWPDEELTEVEIEDMELRIQAVQDDISEIEGILGLC